MAEIVTRSKQGTTEIELKDIGEPHLEYSLLQDANEDVVSLMRFTEFDDEAEIIKLNREAAKWLLESLRHFAETGFLIKGNNN